MSLPQRYQNVATHGENAGHQDQEYAKLNHYNEVIVHRYLP